MYSTYYMTLDEFLSTYQILKQTHHECCKTLMCFTISITDDFGEAVPVMQCLSENGIQVKQSYPRIRHKILRSKVIKMSCFLLFVGKGNKRRHDLDSKGSRALSLVPSEDFGV